MNLKDCVPDITTTEARKMYREHYHLLQKATYYEKQVREDGYIEMADLLVFSIEYLKDRMIFFKRGFDDSPIKEIRDDSLRY